MEPRPVPIASAELSPEEVAGRTFPSARRGLDGEAVRRFLGDVSRQLRLLQGREADLRQLLAEAERRAASPELDDDTLTAAVGAETAKVLLAAREAARELVTNAELRAGQLVGEAERMLADQTAAAQREASAILDSARSSAEGQLEDARLECRSMVEEAREARRRILADLAGRRRELHVQLEQIRAAKDALVDVVEGTAGSIEQIRKRLSGSEEEARQAADDAADAADAAADDVADFLTEDVSLERLVAEAFAGPAAAEPLLIELPQAEDVPEPQAEAAQEVEPAPEVEPAQEVVPAPEPEPEPLVEALVPATAEPEPADEALEASPVDELFAKIRASRAEEVAEARSVLAAAEVEVGAPPEGMERVEDLASPGSLRDELAAPGVLATARAVKRTLRSDQNELLAVARQSSAGDLSTLLPGEEATARLAAAAEHGLTEAFLAGRRFAAELLGGGPAERGEPGAEGGPSGPLARRLAETVTGDLREQLDRSISGGSGEEDLGRVVGAAYRAWRADRVEALCGDYATEAFCAGVIQAASSGAALVRWSVGEVGEVAGDGRDGRDGREAAGRAPCADCDDNALAGALSPGSPFPTGQPSPPVHPGCRCLLVPVTA